MAPANDVHGEGIRIPPVRLVRGGALDAELLRLLLANMRVPREREGDLLAQLAANRVGERRLLAMAAEHGSDEVRARGEQLMTWAEELVRAVVRDLPRGVYPFEDELEAPCPGTGRNVRIRLRLETKADGLVFDFRATDPETSGAVNTVRAVTISAVFYVMRLLLPPGTPTNDGVLRCVRILTTPRTVVDARYPAAVAAGNVETSQRLVDVALGALAKALPGRIPAASAGTMSNLTFGGADLSGPSFAYYETIAGGAGASASGPGLNAVQTHMTNTRNTPIEALETHYPARVVRYTVRRGSGGAGRHAGGDGVVRRLRFLAPVRVGWVAERQTRGPWGLAGGGEGESGRASYRAEGDRRDTPLAGKAGIELAAGSELEVRTPGGGGYGRAR